MTIDGDDINIQNLCMFVQGSSSKTRIHIDNGDLCWWQTSKRHQNLKTVALISVQ